MRLLVASDAIARLTIGLFMVTFDCLLPKSFLLLSSQRSNKDCVNSDCDRKGADQKQGPLWVICVTFCDALLCPFHP
jgi:hypothetical protein